MTWRQDTLTFSLSNSLIFVHKILVIEKKVLGFVFKGGLASFPGIHKTRMFSCVLAPCCPPPHWFSFSLGSGQCLFPLLYLESSASLPWHSRKENIIIAFQKDTLGKEFYAMKTTVDIISWHYRAQSIPTVLQNNTFPFNKQMVSDFPRLKVVLFFIQIKICASRETQKWWFAFKHSIPFHYFHVKLWVCSLKYNSVKWTRGWV